MFKQSPKKTLSALRFLRISLLTSSEGVITYLTAGDLSAAERGRGSERDCWSVRTLCGTRACALPAPPGGGLYALDPARPRGRLRGCRCRARPILFCHRSHIRLRRRELPERAARLRQPRRRSALPGTQRLVLRRR